MGGPLSGARHTGSGSGTASCFLPSSRSTRRSTRTPQSREPPSLPLLLPSATSPSTPSSPQRTDSFSAHLPPATSSLTQPPSRMALSPSRSSTPSTLLPSPAPLSAPPTIAPFPTPSRTSKRQVVNQK